MTKPKLQTYAVSIWSQHSQMPACCEHVEARSEAEAQQKAEAAAAKHGEGYRVQWVKPFEGRRPAA